MEKVFLVFTIVISLLTRTQTQYEEGGQSAANALCIQALQMEFDNPRVFPSKVQFELERVQYFGADRAPFCEELKKSMELFDNFKTRNYVSHRASNWAKLYIM